MIENKHIYIIYRHSVTITGNATTPRMMFVTDDVEIAKRVAKEYNDNVLPINVSLFKEHYSVSTVPLNVPLDRTEKRN